PPAGPQPAVGARPGRAASPRRRHVPPAHPGPGHRTGTARRTARPGRRRPAPDGAHRPPPGRGARRQGGHAAPALTGRVRPRRAPAGRARRHAARGAVRLRGARGGRLAAAEPAAGPRRRRGRQGRARRADHGASPDRGPPRRAGGPPRPRPRRRQARHPRPRRGRPRADAAAPTASTGGQRRRRGQDPRRGPRPGRRADPAGHGQAPGRRIRDHLAEPPVTEPPATVASARRSAPVATQGIVSAEVRRARRHSPEGGTLFLRAAPEWRGPGTFDVDGATVQIAPCTTLLGVLDAVSGKSADYLVVLSPFERRDLGDSLLSRAVGHDIIAVNRWDLVRHAVGAKRLDARLAAPENAWLSDALLEAQPPGGWPKIKGALLDLDTARAAVTAARLGLSERAGGADAASLLEWAQDIAAVSRF